MSTPAAVRVWEYHAVTFRRVWKSSVFGNLVQPLLYLLGLGVGVGGLVDERATAGGAIGDVGYFSYVAPAILAVTGVMVAANHSLWDLLDKFKWSATYQAQHITPLRGTDIANGHALWLTTQVAMSVGGVAVILLLFSDTRTVWLLPAVPFGVLTGLAMALPIAAWTSTREGDVSFPNIIRFIVIPMFLFAGTFYPVDQLPGWLEPVAYVTPLWHGVELCRRTMLSTLTATAAVGHIAVLVAMAAVGWAACRVTFSRRLSS